MENILNNKKIVGIIVACIAIICICVSFIMAAGLDAIAVKPKDNQYFELKAVEIIGNEGEEKQVIMELVGYNIEFQRIKCAFFL